MIIKTLINILYTTLFSYKSILYSKFIGNNNNKENFNIQISKFK